MKTRPIKMYRMRDDNTWDTVFVDILAITHPDMIEEVATKAAVRKFGPGDAYAIYNTYDDEVPDLDDVWIIHATGDATAQRCFIIEGARNEEEALEKMENGNRTCYGPDKVVEWAGYQHKRTYGGDEYDVEKW